MTKVIIIGLFLTILIMNFYFRVKVLKVYKRLANSRVEFTPAQLLNRQKLVREVLPNFPEYKEDILLFANLVKRSLGMMLGMILIIIVVAFTINSLQS